MPKVELPVACSLNDGELQERKSTVLHMVSSSILEVKELRYGYAYRFAADEQTMTQIMQVISLERKCCPFLSFGVSVQAGDDSAWLEMSGPEGTKSLLATLFEADHSLT